MNIYCLGINHKNTSVNLRERLAFPKERVETALARLGCGDRKALEPLQEMVILSTCNRVEIYATAIRPAFDVLEKFMAETSNVSAHEFSSFVYRLADEDAAAHLMRVAAGLDSMVLGEPQILGQVADALSHARSQGTAGKILSRLFQSAIHAGKRARTETAISHNPASVASVAMESIQNHVADLTTCQAMILGAGEMAELSIEALIKRGLNNLTIVNRTRDRANELAHTFHGRAASFEELPELLINMDVMITSTGAPHFIIHPRMVEAAIAQRNGKSLVIIDIAVPRDVDPLVAEIPGVYLFDIDQLSISINDSISKRKQEIPQIEAILDEELAQFMQYLGTLDIVPLIVKMRDHVDGIRQTELEKAMRSMPDLSPKDQERVTALTKSIVNKILHTPTARLKNEANGPNVDEYADVTRSLFGLD